MLETVLEQEMSHITLQLHVSNSILHTCILLYPFLFLGAIGEFSPVYLRATSQFPPEFQGDLFFENVEFMLLGIINASSPGIQTVSCSPATP